VQSWSQDRSAGTGCQVRILGNPGRRDRVLLGCDADAHIHGAGLAGAGHPPEGLRDALRLSGDPYTLNGKWEDICPHRCKTIFLVSRNPSAVSR
jgi:hypothetical protein